MAAALFRNFSHFVGENLDSCAQGLRFDDFLIQSYCRVGKRLQSRSALVSTGCIPNNPGKSFSILLFDRFATGNFCLLGLNHRIVGRVGAQ